MADSAMFTRIYELKSLGVDKLLGDINRVIAGLEKIGQVKNTIGGGDFLAAEGMTEFNKQITLLVQNVDKVVSATEKNAAAQSKLADSISEVMAAQQNVTMNMKESAAAMGENLTAAAAGVTKVQGAMQATQSAAIEFTGSIVETAGALAQLKESSEVTSDLIKRLKSELESGQLTQEEYNIQIAEATAELTQYKVQITETSAALKGMIKDELANEGSTKGARAEIALLNREQEELIVLRKGSVTLTDEEIAANIRRRDAIIAEKNALHEFLGANADANLSRILNIGNYPNPAAELSDITAQLGKIITAGGQGSAEFQRLSARAKELKGAMAELKAATTEVTTTGDKLTSMAERMGLRMLLNIFIFQAAIEGVQLLYKSITENIQGTDEYIKKQEELKQANDEMIQSFTVLSDEISHYTELQSKLDLEQMSPEDQDKINAVLDNTVAGYKRKEDAIKAIGIVNGQVYDAEATQLKASSELKQKELEVLQRKAETISKIQGLLFSSQFKNESAKEWDDFMKDDENKSQTGVSDLFNNSDIPDEIKKELVAKIRKGVNDGASIQKVLEALRREYAGKDVDTTQDIRTKTQEAVNAEAAFQSKLNALTYSKNLELKEQLFQLDEQSRQLRGKEDAASMDKIVADTSAKYGLLIHGVEKQIEELRKHYPNGILPDDLQNKYNDILAKFSNQQKQDIANQEYEKAKRDRDNFSTNENLLSGGDASISSYNSSYGVPNYGRMVEALDKETAAKKIALENQFKNQVKNVNDENQLIELEAQQKLKIEQVDKESYKKRLGFANEYFKRLTEDTIAASDIIIQQIDTETTNKLTAILTGKGSDSTKERRSFRATQRGIIDTANETIIQQKGILPDAQEATRQAKAALDEAKGDDAKAEAKKKYNEALSAQVEIENKLAHAMNDRANAEQRLKDKDKELRNEIIDRMIGAAEKIANSYMELLQKEDAYRQTMAQRSLDYNTKQQQALTQSKQQELATEKAHDTAQRELDRKKMQDAAKRAEQQLTISYVVALAKAIEEESPLAAAAATVEYTFALGMLAKAPAYAEGTGGGEHPGGLAWVGDGGEPEVAKIGQKYFVTPSTPTLVNLQKGATVTPFSQIQNIGGNLGAGLRPPVFSSSSTRASGNDSAQAITGLYTLLGHALNGMANQHVSFDTNKGSRALKNSYFKKVSL